MTFDEWYDSRESVKCIPPELQEFWREGVKMVWDEARRTDPVKAELNRFIDFLLDGLDYDEAWKEFTAYEQEES